MKKEKNNKNVKTNDQLFSEGVNEKDLSRIPETPIDAPQNANFGNMPIIKERITKARKIAGMTQKDLAQRVGKSENTIRNWENGNTLKDFPFTKLIQLARILNVDYQFLIDPEYDEPNHEQILLEKIHKAFFNQNENIIQALKLLGYGVSLSSDSGDDLLVIVTDPSGKFVSMSESEWMRFADKIPLLIQLELVDHRYKGSPI